jgi:hypothetical protein
MCVDDSSQPNAEVPIEAECVDANGTMSDRETYNVVSDTIGGLNYRAKDNIFQALFILFSVLLLSGCGALLLSGCLVGSCRGTVARQSARWQA